MRTFFSPSVASPSSVSAALSFGTVIASTSACDHFGVANMKVNYPLCGGYHDNCYVPKCATGNHNCNYMVSMKKNYDIGWTKQNTVLVCCFVARTANENNLRTEEEVKKYLNSSPSPSTSP